MSTYGEQKKAWASEWAKIRKDYLSGKLLDVTVLPVGGGVPLCFKSRGRYEFLQEYLVGPKRQG